MAGIEGVSSRVEIALMHASKGNRVEIKGKKREINGLRSRMYKKRKELLAEGKIKSVGIELRGINEHGFWGPVTYSFLMTQGPDWECAVALIPHDEFMAQMMEGMTITEVPKGVLAQARKSVDAFHKALPINEEVQEGLDEMLGALVEKQGMGAVVTVDPAVARLAAHFGSRQDQAATGADMRTAKEKALDKARAIQDAGANADALAEKVEGGPKPT